MEFYEKLGITGGILFFLGLFISLGGMVLETNRLIYIGWVITTLGVLGGIASIWIR